MASIIVTGNTASQSAIAGIMSSLRAAGINNATLIAAEAPADIKASGRFLSSQGSSLGTCLAQAFSSNQDKQLILLDASTEMSAERIGALLGAMASIRGESFGYAPLELDGERIDLSDLTIDSLLEFAAPGQLLPLLCCSLPASLTAGLDLSAAENLTECMSHAVVAAVAAGMPLVNSSSSIRLPDNTAHASLSLSPAAAARLLRQTLDLCNIEDLFPEHPWSSHQEESAAASYHTLAALFIRGGDLESANRCLALSDTFEDSPRSLALKGFIAKERGELLGAVANMISSLQQYEIRKRNDNGEHYLTFKPLDLEVINTSMRDGLSALNKRDNGQALECFTEAILNFDSFYAETGISKAGR